MPTVSQWKILHEMLKTGRLRPDKVESGEREENEDKTEEGKNRAISKEAPKRRNSFHFFQNARGILTILCRPKSVPVSFGEPKEQESETDGNHDNVQPTNERISEQTDETSTITRHSTGEIQEENKIENNSQSNSQTDMDFHPNSSNGEKIYTQPYEVEQEEVETLRLWDGISDFPELLDPNSMIRRTSFPTRFASASSNKRSSFSAKNSDTKVNKSVSFSRPCSNTIHYDKDYYEDDEEDEDDLGITVDNVDTILPKFDNPYRKWSQPDQSMLAPSISPLRPLKSAPALRRITKSISAFNTHNMKRCQSSMSYTDVATGHQGSTTEETDNSIHGYKIRHTTFAYKEFSWKKDKPHFQWGQKVAESEHFEPYVIQNGRLVRRGSQSAMVGGNIAANNSAGNVRRNSSKLSIFGKDEASTLSAICNAFMIRGTKHNNNKDQDSGDQQRPLARALSRPSSTKEVSRWSMATQSIITRSVSLASTATASASGIAQSKDYVTDIEEIELPEEVQANLQKLGFRRQKGKKKKLDKTKKSSTHKKGEGKEETVKNNVIDIRQDPVLIKIQKKNRNVGTFTCEPDSQPHAVCFEIKGSLPSHADVVEEMEKLRRAYPDVVIEKLQFDYRSLVNNSPDVDNRWIITTNSVNSRNRLAGSYIRICGQETQLRRYDDVITTEYQQYRRMMDFVKMMNNRLGVKEK